MILPTNIDYAVHLLETAQPGAVFATVRNGRPFAMAVKSSTNTYRVKYADRQGIIVLHDSEQVVYIIQP